MNRELQNMSEESLQNLEEIVETELLTVEDIRERMDTTEKGKIRQSIQNCKYALEHDPCLKGAICRNEMTCQIDIMKKMPWKRRGVHMTDTDMNELLKFAVIISQSNGKWVFCKHKERDTYEVPGGHREAGEDIFETAKRELQEETGAIKFEIKPICVYSVTGKTRVNDTGEETFGLLCFAEITEFAKELHSEMEKVVLMDELPENWTYPLIQPKLIEKYLQVKIIL